MARQDLGKKRSCTNCEEKFYDLNRVPFKCPKCGEINTEPAATGSAAKKSTSPAAGKAKHKAEVKPEVNNENKGESNDGEIDEELLADDDDDDDGDATDGAGILIEDDNDESDEVTGIVAGNKPDAEAL